MNTTHTSSARPSCCSLLSTLALIASAPILFSVHASAQTLITSFEESEGFTLNQSPAGTAGWTGSNNNSRIFATDEMARDGVWSIKATPGSPDVRADSPNYYSEGYIGISYWFTNPTATYTASQASVMRSYITYGNPVDGEEGRIQLVVRYGNNSTDPMRINYILQGGAGPNIDGFQNIGAGVLDLSDWNLLSTTLDFENETFSVNIGSTTVLNNIDLKAGTVTGSTGLRQVWLWSPQSGAVFYDEVTAIPEPHTLAMIAGLLVLVMAMVFRRHSKHSRSQV